MVRTRQDIFGFLCEKILQGLQKSQKTSELQNRKKQKHDDLPNCLESSQKKFGGHTTKIADC